jgi:hypothetical protein
MRRCDSSGGETFAAALSQQTDVIVSAWAGHPDLSFTKRTYVLPPASDLVAARCSAEPGVSTDGVTSGIEASVATRSGRGELALTKR